MAAPVGTSQPILTECKGRKTKENLPFLVSPGVLSGRVASAEEGKGSNVENNKKQKNSGARLSALPMGEGCVNRKAGGGLSPTVSLKGGGEPRAQRFFPKGRTHIRRKTN